MTQFFLEYGLFFAKSITVLLAVVAVVLVIAGAVNSKKQHDSDIEIENINEKLDELKSNLESEMLSKEDYKAHKKAKKKEKKQEKKNEKKQKKSAELDTEEKPKLFIARFEGDMQASEVDTLREVITGILTVAKDKDEVLVVLESCGGIVHNYGLGASQLARIKAHGLKLTVAVDLVAASGGYMMACVADKIIAAPFAVLGSIGVLAELPNFYRILKKHDIDIEHHTAGDYKTTLTMLGENTDKDREKFREELEDTHQLFKEFVKSNREIIDIDNIATGEHWYGTKALELKLVDELQTSDDYILASRESKDIFEVSYEIQESLKDKISEIISGSISKALSSTLYKLSSLNKL